MRVGAAAQARGGAFADLAKAARSLHARSSKALDGQFASKRKRGRAGRAANGPELLLPCPRRCIAAWRV